MEMKTKTLLKDLDKYAQKLPKKYRSKLYKVAYDFLSEGGGNGVIMAFRSEIQTDQHEIFEYLEKKMNEAKV